MDLYFFAYMHKNMEIIPLCPPPPRDPSATQEMDPSQIQFETAGYDYVSVGSVRPVIFFFKQENSMKKV